METAITSPRIAQMRRNLVAYRVSSRHRQMFKVKGQGHSVKFSGVTRNSGAPEQISLPFPLPSPFSIPSPSLLTLSRPSLPSLPLLFPTLYSPFHPSIPLITAKGYGERYSERYSFCYNVRTQRVLAEPGRQTHFVQFTQY